MSNPNQWIVVCQVSGGVTGLRESLLQRDGAVQYFASEDEARSTAAELNKEKNSRFATATFRYWAEEGCASKSAIGGGL